MELACAEPLLMPARVGLLRNAEEEEHPLVSSGVLNLLAWKVSGDLSESKDFWKGLQNYWRSHGLLAQGIDTKEFGEYGLVGVWQGVWIPWRLL